MTTIRKTQPRSGGHHPGPRWSRRRIPGVLPLRGLWTLLSSVYFHDNLMGALALYNFAEMLRKAYGVNGVRLELSDQTVVFPQPAVLDVLTSRPSGRNV